MFPQALLNPAAEFPLALQLRSVEGATIGEVFSFLSGLYFRGKLTYARAHASATLWTGQPYGAEGGLIGTAAFIAGFLPNIQLAPISKTPQPC